MNNKDLQRLLSTFPDDLEVYEVGAYSLEPVTDVSERRGNQAVPYLVLETVPIPPEKPGQQEAGTEPQTVTIRP